ncbi:MAG TPA: T9SS type B sorting domain-containing protein [Parafilimonas sp.]|nr:T9SS type B sorting domain-containing protein [Parafilimonas sp.]
MLRVIALLTLTLMQICVAAQQPVFSWAKAFTNSTDNSIYRDLSNGRTVAVDKAGNVYSAGLFQYSIDLDPGPGVHSITATNSSGTGIYISKLDANGNFVWGEQVSVLTEFGTIELKVDDNGNVYLVSALMENVDMDPGPGVYIMSPTGFRDAFVLKLDTDGNFVWAKQFGGPGDTGAECTAVAIDNAGNLIVCGTFNNTVDFDPGTGVYDITSTAHIQSFIEKLSSNGNFIWALQFGNSPVVYSGSTITDVKCDKAGNIYTTGTFSGDCDFDPGSAVYSMHTSSFYEVFTSKLDSKGNFVWAKQIANATDNYYSYVNVRGIDLDNDGNVITTGYFVGDFDFDPGSQVYRLNEYTVGAYQAYIQKLNNKGDLIWAEQIGSNEGSNGNDVVVDRTGNIYMIGDFSKETDFDPGPGQYFINSDNEYAAASLVKLNANGGFVYAVQFASNCLLRRMDIDELQDLYITGYFAGTMDFDPGPGVYTLSSTMDESPYVLKLSKCPNATAAELHVDTCRSYTLNNETFDSSGIYQQVSPNARGCDSLITLYLSISKQFNEQTISICEGESFFAGGAYQTTAGVYNDTLNTTTGCDSVVSTQLIVHPKPQPDLGPDKDVCSNSEVIVTPGNFKDYLWQDLSIHNSFKINAPGTYWVKVSNEYNCTASDTITIQSMFPSPANFLKATDSICDDESLLIMPLNSYSAYYWSNGAVSKDITVQQPGIYSLTVTDINHCEGSDTIHIFQKQCNRGVYIPSAFTPNHDGKNDLFKPQIFGNVVKYHFVIFNRWGKIVFETNDIHKGWDGTYNNLPQRTDTFVWICSFQLEGSKEERRNGSLVLLR